MKSQLISLLLLFQLSGLSAQATVNALRLSSAPEIDGKVIEESWGQCTPVSSFIQREPVPGLEATIETEIFITFDNENLYVAFKCYGPPDEVIAKEMARDVDLSNDDRVQLILDTYNDHRNAYWFQIGPRGSIGDAIISENGAAFNKAWDGLWTGKARISEKGWEAEISIPFKTLSFDPENNTWGLKLIRYQKYREETVYWPQANINTHKFQVSDAGMLQGLEGISQGLGLDLVPYGLGGIDIRENEKPDLIGDAGFEAYYNITSNLKAALTVNTDFAQTEVDAREINLTRFSLFYPEKRDFFLDGANYFNFGINGDRDNSWNTRLIPFFSRRIGLDKDGNPIPVEYGGKITGQSGKWNIGAMYMRDHRENWNNRNFAVSRITRNFHDQSQFGIISTFGNALHDTLNFLLGADLKLATSKFRGDKNLSFVGYGLKSANNLPEHSTEGRDLAYGIEVNYPNDQLAFRIGHMAIQENFIAGTGFVPRPGIKESYGELKLGIRPGKWGLMQVLTLASGDYIHNFTGQSLTREWNFTPLSVRFLSGDAFHFKHTRTYELLEASFDIYPGYTVAEGTHSFNWNTLGLTSAKKRKIWIDVAYRFGDFFNGSRKEWKFSTGYKIAVPVFIGTEVIRNNIQLGESGFIARVYRLNLNLLFNPDITLYNFVQYDSESDKMGWQSRFQWILKPGKEIFLVWNSLVRDPYNRFALEEAGARLKLKYTIRF